MPYKNLAVELLQKLLDGEIKTRSRKNIVQGRSFAELLENAIKRYQNRAIETAQVIEEMIALARELREADRREENLGLTQDEAAFYDALEVNACLVGVIPCLCFLCRGLDANAALSDLATARAFLQDAPEQLQDWRILPPTLRITDFLPAT